MARTQAGLEPDEQDYPAADDELAEQDYDDAGFDDAYDESGEDGYGYADEEAERRHSGRDGARRRGPRQRAGAKTRGSRRSGDLDPVARLAGDDPGHDAVGRAMGQRERLSRPGSASTSAAC